MAEPEYPIVLGSSRGTKAMMWVPTAAVDLLLIGVMFFALSNSYSGFGGRPAIPHLLAGPGQVLMSPMTEPHAMGYCHR